MLKERGFEAKHVSVNRRVLAYASMIAKRLRQFRNRIVALRVDKTYVKSRGPRAQGRDGGRDLDRPDRHQRLGGRRLREGRRGDRSQEADLWTEVCLAFPAIDSLRAGYEVSCHTTRWAAPRRSRTKAAAAASNKPVRRLLVRSACCEIGRTKARRRAW